ncbi:protein-tyrosine phosphatase [Hamadaea flava]|uniref:protein-tyrosine-phosphatase n=1 Tax=Hamadaea flava TaxID=1742688 RepID=A0ABV8LRX3_9ACTN|nr:tyrosine protein phosphatase [Hamadaea flava]MCP2327281.1 protein-tyrosine phosphatase [Hamadaea flava]
MAGPFLVDWPVSGRLAVMSRPTGGDALVRALHGLRRKGVDALVCALTEGERDLLGLAAEPEIARDAGLAYIDFPIADFSVPDLDDLAELAAKLAVRLRSGDFIVAHCRGGIGRSGIVASAALIALGATAEQAMELVSEARGVPAPETEEQRALLRRLAERPARF